MLEPILSKAQIFETIIENKYNRKELNLNSFCYALLYASKDITNLKIEQDKWEITSKQMFRNCLTRYVSIKDIKSHVEKYNPFINLTIFTKKDQKRNKKRGNIGNKDTSIITCNLGMFKQRSNMNHFFYNCQIPIPKYFTQHIDDVLKYSKKHNKSIEWAFKVTKFPKNYFIADKSKFNPIDLIYNLFDKDVFILLSYTEIVYVKNDLNPYFNIVIDPKIMKFTGDDKPFYIETYCKQESY